MVHLNNIKRLVIFGSYIKRAVPLSPDTGWVYGKFPGIP